MTKPRAISQDEALAMYVAMGPERSQRKLQQQIEADPNIKTLSPRTIAAWSKRYDWPARVHEHEAQIAGAVHAKAIEAQAQATFDTVFDCQQTAHAIFERVQALLPQIKSTTPADLRTLTSIGVDLVKTAEVLTGGVSDRTEALGGAPDEDTAALLEELKGLAHGAETRH